MPSPGERSELKTNASRRRLAGSCAARAPGGRRRDGASGSWCHDQHAGRAGLVQQRQVSPRPCFAAQRHALFSRPSASSRTRSTTIGCPSRPATRCLAWCRAAARSCLPGVAAAVSDREVRRRAGCTGRSVAVMRRAIARRRRSAGCAGPRTAVAGALGGACEVARHREVFDDRLQLLTAFRSARSSASHRSGEPGSCPRAGSAGARTATTRARTRRCRRPSALQAWPAATRRRLGTAPLTSPAPAAPALAHRGVAASSPSTSQPAKRAEASRQLGARRVLLSSAARPGRRGCRRARVGRERGSSSA